MISESGRAPGGLAVATGAPAARAVRARGGARRRPSWAALAALVAVSVVMAAPFVWLVSASLKPRSQVFDVRLIPDPVAWENYARMWDVSLMPIWVWNSVIVAFLAALAVTASSALVAFAFAYFQFRGRNALFGLVLATMMLPGVVTMIPQFLIWDALGWTDTLVPLWAPNLFGSAFYIFLLRQFFLTIPRELYEAGTVDGANPLHLFRFVALPLTLPALVVVFVFELKASWADLLRPLVYLRDAAQFTLPLGLKTLLDQFGEGGEMRWEIILAASVVATIPMVVIFFLAQRAFVEGIATTGSKG
jgi:multiple sugar transport system permease protein